MTANLDDKISAGKAARELLALVDCEAQLQKDSLHLYGVIATHCANKIRCEVKSISNNAVSIMSDDEAKRFEQSIAPLGAFKGYKVKDIDQTYLIQLTENPFIKQCKRYIASDHFRRLYEQT